MKTLLKNGTIFDGSMNAPFVGDVLIEDDKIISVGKSVEEADEIIDMTGKYVCPGFIDGVCVLDFFWVRVDSV